MNTKELLAQGVPDGWQLVPKEPTDAMVRAALHLDLSYMPGHDGHDRAAVYKSMLASAPPAPQADKLVKCSYGDSGYACCEGGPCAADVHNNSVLASVVQQAKPQPLSDEQIDAGIVAWFATAVTTNDGKDKGRPFRERMRAAMTAAHGIPGSAA